MRTLRVTSTSIVASGLFVLLASQSVNAWDGGRSNDRSPNTWNLARDIGVTGNQIGFQQGAAGVWYFMMSGSTVHNPQLYRFIREFNAPALPATDIHVPDGFSGWQEPVDIQPSVDFNFTDHVITLENFDVPPHSVYMHPGPHQFTIVAWQSPVDGAVKIRGSFTDIDPNCGNGVLVTIDKNARTLASGDIPNGAARSFNLWNVRVRVDDVLYFIVDPKEGDHICDSTKLDLEISRVDDHR